MKVSDLKNLEKNPRRISKEAFDKLKDRITKRGFHDVIKIDAKNFVLSGNQRLRALQDLKIKDVNVLVPSRKLTDEERDTIILESNRQDGLWDFDMLSSFEDSVLLEAGFSEKELQADLEALAVKPDEMYTADEKIKFVCGDIKFELDPAQYELFKIKFDEAQANNNFLPAETLIMLIS